MDGPAVKKAFLKQISNDIEASCQKTMLNIGTCLLHPTHTSFEKGIAELSFDSDELVINIHSFFKFSACRTSDYRASTLETNIESLNILKHVSSRWLSLKRVLERILHQWENLKWYFFNFLLLQQSYKTVSKTARFKSSSQRRNLQNTSILCRLPSR